jgi:hypothetical protein
LQERKQQLQQEAEELQEQLADMQRLYEQQQLMLQELQQQQQQQLGSQGPILHSTSEEGVGTSTVREAAVRQQQQQQQQLEESQLPGVSGEQLYHHAASVQQQHVAQLQLHSQAKLQQARDAAGFGEHLPVSAPASLDADADASRHGPTAAASAADVHRVQRSYMPGDYASAVEDASSAAGSMVDSSLSRTAVGLQHWEDDSTASSKVARGRSWFGMFGRPNSKQGRSALV